MATFILSGDSRPYVGNLKKCASLGALNKGGREGRRKASELTTNIHVHNVSLKVGRNWGMNRKNQCLARALFLDLIYATFAGSLTQ